MREAGKVRAATPDAIAEAATELRGGELIAFPTETVYGLGANATDDRAIAAVFAAKARPTFNPLIVHIPGTAAAAALARFDDVAHALARRFWPGPLTLVLPRVPACPVSHLATAGLETIAVRAPAHPVARALMGRAGVPIAAPSANPSGAISPTTAAHVAAVLGDKVALILDGGPCAVGIESTVLDLSGDRPTILRPGGVTHEAIRDAVGPVTITEAPARHARKSPGMLTSHYAPRLPVRLDATS
ncbi:MAG: L-threonylcarbamoyladenylate synthase, partial [Alphaproteobacteria bacterium]